MTSRKSVLSILIRITKKKFKIKCSDRTEINNLFAHSQERSQSGTINLEELCL